jgi:hypothetical protein
VLPTWDKQIQSLCYQVNQIIEKITSNEQEWISKAMEEQMVHWIIHMKYFCKHVCGSDTKYFVLSLMEKLSV